MQTREQLARAQGALFHIGDGHAWQADGEILGTGIEISMDVVVNLEVIKGKETERRHLLAGVS